MCICPTAKTRPDRSLVISYRCVLYVGSIRATCRMIEVSRNLNRMASVNSNAHQENKIELKILVRARDKRLNQKFFP